MKLILLTRTKIELFMSFFLIKIITEFMHILNFKIFTINFDGKNIANENI
jgi:hypothetical protein